MLSLNFRTLTGDTVEMNLRPWDRIIDAKEFLRRRFNQPYRDMRLIYAGKNLDNTTFADNNIPTNACVHVIFSDYSQHNNLQHNNLQHNRPIATEEECKRQPKTFQIPEEFVTFLIPLAEKAAREYWPFDVNAPPARVVVLELLMALICKCCAGARGNIEATMECSVPVRLDMVWHLFILETSKYHKFCEEVCGIFLHHTSLTSADVLEDKNARVSLTRLFRQQIFRGHPVNEWCWESEESVNAQIPARIAVQKAAEMPVQPLEPIASRTRKRQKNKVVEEQAEEPKNQNVEQNAIQIFVKTLTGKTITVRTTSTMRIEGIRNLIMASEGIPADQQRLIFSGMNLYDGKRVSDYRINMSDTLHLVMKLSGC